MDLLKSETDMNVTMEFHKACMTGDVKKVRFLLSKKEKIDVNQLDEKVTLSQHVEIKGNADIVYILLSLGVNVNEKGIGFTSLHVACHKGNLHITEILLENGADIDAIVDSSNRTPLHIAIRNKNTSITKLLLKNGCKTNIRDYKGHTAFELVMTEGYLDGVKQLAFNDE